MTFLDYLPLFVTPAFALLVIIVVGAMLLRDRQKARRAARLHPGE